MRQQTRTRTEIHALLSAVVGDLLQRESLPAADGLCYDTEANEKFSPEMEEPLTECSDLNRWIEETSEQPTETALQDSLDGNIDLPKICDQIITEKNSRFADAVDGRFEVGLRSCHGLINTTERTSGFVPFQRTGLHASNRNVPILPADSRSHMPVIALRDSTGHNQQAQLPVNMKQEHDTTLISSRGACIGEAFECKQEEFEEDTCEYPFDLSSLSDDGGSLRHEDAILLQQQESKSLMSVSGTPNWLFIVVTVGYLDTIYFPVCLTARCNSCDDFPNDSSWLIQVLMLQRAGWSFLAWMSKGVLLVNIKPLLTFWHVALLIDSFIISLSNFFLRGEGKVFGRPLLITAWFEIQH
jgi:hypothetical protein